MALAIQNKAISEIQSHSPVRTALKPTTSSESFQRVFDRFSAQWDALATRQERISVKLPAEVRELFEVQKLSQQFQLRSELLSKAAESVNSTLRRLQQMGGS